MKEKIFKLIENTYNSNNANHTYDDKLAYVNLFADVDLEIGLQGIPTHEEGYDVYFTQLTYDSIAGVYDIYPDLMIGRCSVDDTTQVKNVVHKILNFKPEDLAWKNKMLTIYGNWAPSYVSDQLLEIEEILGGSFEKQLIASQELYDYDLPSWDSLAYTTSAILDAYADGQMFVNYLGHGSPSWWAYPGFFYGNLDTLQDNITPFIVTGSCSTGAFQIKDDCIAEKFLSYDSIRGAIGYIGSSQISYIGDLPLSSMYYSLTFNNSSYVLGESFMESKFYNVPWRNHYNLFGDPALSILYENIRFGGG